ncbi:MAG: hypothetical protein KY434_02910 [Actinobacteria bacterium]|nr:hypothetical protein [Actinomycetota bacterium]
MLTDAELAIVASPRPWALRLHRFVADHGGARVRTTVLHADDALAERYDVLVVDDTTSFLTRRLVGRVRDHGRRILGVFDPEDPRGKGELMELGVDDVIERDASPREFLVAIAGLLVDTPAAAATPAETEATDRPHGRLTAAPETGGGGRCVVAVGGPSGGPGATEVAVHLAAALAVVRRCLLVDADDVAPSVAQRLDLAPYPNVIAAVEAAQRDDGSLPGTLASLSGNLSVLPGLAHPGDWADVRAGEVVDAMQQLAAHMGTVVVNVGHRLEDVPSAGGPPRYGLSRAVLGMADVVVGVGLPTPVGVSRLLEWVVSAASLARSTACHLVLSRAPASAFLRAEISEEIRRTFEPSSLSFLPADRRLESASWRGEIAVRGPFARAVAGLAGLVAPVPPGPAARGAR